jgi:hypothetical protein
VCDTEISDVVVDDGNALGALEVVDYYSFGGDAAGGKINSACGEADACNALFVRVGFVVVEPYVFVSRYVEIVEGDPESLLHSGRSHLLAGGTPLATIGNLLDFLYVSLHQFSRQRGVTWHRAAIALAICRWTYGLGLWREIGRVINGRPFDSRPKGCRR